MSVAPDMSYLCRDWTPTIDDPVVECHMPAGKAVRLQLSIDKYQPHALPTLLLQACGWRTHFLNSRGTEGVFLWDLVEHAGTYGHFSLTADPRHPYYRRPTLRHHALYAISPRGSAHGEIVFDPAAGAVTGVPIWTKHDKPWLLRIGCPKRYTGMVTPLGSVITCRWEILDSKGGPT